MKCDKTPKCTLEQGHDGPCEPKVPWYKRLANAVGTAIGEAKFGQ